MNLNKKRTARSRGLRVMNACCRITLHGFSVSVNVYDMLWNLRERRKKQANGKLLGWRISAKRFHGQSQIWNIWCVKIAWGKSIGCVDTALGYSWAWWRSLIRKKQHMIRAGYRYLKKLTGKIKTSAWDFSGRAVCKSFHWLSLMVHNELWGK